MSTPSAPATDRPEPEHRDSVTAPAEPRPSRGRWLPVVAALVGGAIGWWLVERYESPFPAPEEMQALANKRMATIPLTEEENRRLAWHEARQMQKNSGAAMAMIGLPLAALVGLAAGLAVRSFGLAVVGLVIGAVSGGLAGAAAGWGSALAFQSLWVGLGLAAPYAAMAGHTVGWAFVALPVAVVVWLSFRRDGAAFARIAGAAVAGAIAASVLYPVIAAVAFPMSNTELVIPAGSWNRLAWIELAAGLITIVIALGLRRPAGGRG